jgi:hypothetical protein
MCGKSYISLFAEVSTININISWDNLTFTGRKVSLTYLSNVKKDIVIQRRL